MTAWKEKNLWERIVDRQGRLESVRSVWDPQREDIVEFVRPDLNVTIDDKGKFVGSNIYEGTPEWAARTMARGFQGNMVSQSVEWIRHVMPEPFLKGVDEVNKWLQEFTEHMLSVYKNSNYYSIMPLYTLGGITIGSPVIISEEDLKTGKIHCTVPHYTENYLSRNWLGEDDVYHRKFKKTAKEAADEFDKKDLSQPLNNALENGSHYELFEFIQVICSVDDLIFKDLKNTTDKPAKDETAMIRNRPWMSYYIQTEVEEEAKKKPLVSKGYFSKPFSSWHYQRNENETYARTPAWFAIHDIKMDQQMWKEMLEGSQRSTKPSWWAMANMRGVLRTLPGSKNWAQTSQDYDRPPVPLKQQFDYQIGVEVHDRTKMAIERHFHIDLFKMLTSLLDEKKAPPTATQIVGMMGEKAILLSAGVESYEGGLLEEQDTRFIEIEDRAGRLPEPPDVVLEYSEGKINPEFVGPLAQAQRVHYTIRKIHNALGAVDPIFERFPDSINKVKPEVLVELILEETGLPQDAIRNDDEYQKMIEAIRQAQEMERMIESGKTLAEGVSKLQGPTDKTSPLAQVEGAA